MKDAVASGRPLREVARQAGVDDETLDKALAIRVARARSPESLFPLDRGMNRPYTRLVS